MPGEPGGLLRHVAAIYGVNQGDETVTTGNPLSVILAAARSGRVSHRRALEWARRAAAGEDISLIARLAPAGIPVTDAAALASDLAAILAGAPGMVDVNAAGSRGTGEITDAEADSLYAPRSADEAERRFTAAEARQAERRRTSDAELHATLFGDQEFAAAAPDSAPDDSTSPTGPGGHQAFTGVHSHDHPAYQNGDGQSAAAGDAHSHQHAHFGDASHNHHGAQAPLIPAPVRGRR